MKNNLIFLTIGLLIGASVMFFLKKTTTETIRVPVRHVVTVPVFENSFSTFDPKPLPDLRKPEDRYNKELVDKYKKANDSLKEELFKSAVTERSYSIPFEDSIQKITVDAKVIGELKSLSVNYKTKEKKIVIDDTLLIDVPIPKNSLSLYSEVGFPSSIQNIEQSLVLKGGIDYSNKKNWVFGGGYDTNKTIWLKLGKVFKW